MKIGGFASFIVTVLLPALSQASTAYYLNTGQTGAQPSIDSADITDWYAPLSGAPSMTGIMYTSTPLTPLDATFNWDLGGGNFDMKAGSGTTASLTLALWDETTNTEVDWVTWTMTQFCAYKSSKSDQCGQFNGSDPLPIYFTDDHTATGNPTPYTLQTGDSYLVELTSPASSTGSVQYFIKAPGTVNIQDPNGVSLPGDTPEPGTLGLALGGAFFVLLAGARRNRSSAGKL